MKQLILLCLLVMAVAGSAAAQVQVPLPLDPLTLEETQRAEQIARSDARVRELAGGDARLIYVRFTSVKSKNRSNVPQEPTGRYAEVMFHLDPDRGGVRALADLSGGRVVEAVRVAEQSVPIGPADV